MSTDLEQELRSHFAEEARRAPSGGDLYLRTRRRLNAQRMWRVAVPSAAAAVIAIAGWWQPQPTVRPSAESGPTLVEERTGPIEGLGGGDLCAYVYESDSPEGIARPEFAFAGNVETITAPPIESRGGFQVTFEVVEWFKGGSGDTVTVVMGDPAGSQLNEFVGNYEQGDSLLVSGENTDGGYLSWPCGFTRHYEREVANSWREHTSN